MYSRAFWVLSLTTKDTAHGGDAEQAEEKKDRAGLFHGK
jgi:hypothetical protein